MSLMRFKRQWIILILAVISFRLPVAAYPDINLDNERARYETITGMSNRQLYDRGSQYRESDPDSALLYFDVLGKRYTSSMEEDDARLCAEALFNTGKIFYEHSNYSGSMESLLKCWKICEENNFTDILSDAYRTIGNIYSMHSDYELAISFYEKSLAPVLSTDDCRRIHMSLNNLVGAHIFLGNIDQAESYYNRMLDNTCDILSYRYDLLMDGGLIAMHKGENDKALDQLTQAALYAHENNMDSRSIGAVNSWLALIYDAIGQSDSTLYYLHRNENLARETGYNDLLAETIRALAYFYKIRGNRIRSAAYLEEYVALSDSVFNQKVFNSLKNTQFQWELDKSDHIIKGLNDERMRQEIHIEQQRTILWIISIGLIILIILLLIIYRQKRHISTAYNDLFERNRANLEKEKAYRSRIRELQDQTPESSAAARSVPASQSVSPDITPELRERLHRDISAAMDRTELFCDPSFTINRLAEEIGSNTTYISKIINETYGINFRAFLNEYRIKESMSRMGDNGPYSNYTIKAIAESVGFKSQSAFIAAFTKFTGMKPSMYQEIARKRFS